MTRAFTIRQTDRQTDGLILAAPAAGQDGFILCASDAI